MQKTVTIYCVMGLILLLIFIQPSPDLLTTMVYPIYEEKSHSILVTHYDANTWERIPLR